jgi:hypothetical protein
MPQLWYGFFNRFSGTTFYADNTITFFNIFMTFLPPFFISFMARDVDPKTLLNNPSLYRFPQSGAIFSIKKLFLWLFLGFYQDLKTSYSLGLAENEDLIAAEIEISQFDEKTAALTQQSLHYRSLLNEYIGGNAYQTLSSEIPKWPETLSYINTVNLKNNQHYDLLSLHPKAKMFVKNIEVADNGIALAKQDYKPSYKVEVGYGLRLSDTDMGEPRSDLLSAFVSMDVPLFTDKRQDQKLISAQHNKGQKQAEHRLILRQLNALLTAEINNYQQLKARQIRYQDTLLVQAKQHSKLLEQSYQSNTRPFKEVIEAYMHEQNLTLEYQQLYFDSLKSLAEIRYFQAL